MAEELRVVITAKDGASRVFQEVGTAAKQAGTTAEQAGQQGERGFKRMGDAAKSTKIDTVALGAAITALGAGLAHAGNMAMQQERQIIAIRSAYGDAADEMLRFAEELDNVTIFSDDDIRAGERYFATLVNNYDLSIAQVQELMRVTADLASASGVSFEDASNRVTAAIRGEAEAAEYLGLTMNQQSIDRENLTLAMSNQEAAQFRYNALLEQSAVYQGTANEVMRSSSGTVAEWGDRINDLSADIGAMLGPVGTLATGVGTLGIGITGMTGTLGPLIGRLRQTTAATSLLSLATGPVGIALAGIGVAIGIGSKLWGDHQRGLEDARIAYDALQREMESTDQLTRSIQLGGNSPMATMMISMRDDIRNGWDEIQEIHQGGWEAFWGSLSTMPQEDIGQAYLDFLDNSVGRAFVDWAKDNEKLGEEAINAILTGNTEAILYHSGAITEALAEYYSGFEFPPEVRQQVENEFNDLLELMSNPNVDAGKIWEQFDAAYANFRQTGSVDQFIADLDRIEQETVELVQAMQLVDEADYFRMLREYDISDAIGQFRDLQNRVLGVNSELSTGELRAYNEAWDSLADSIKEGSVASDEINQRIANLVVQYRVGAIDAEEFAQGIVDINREVPIMELRINTATATVDAFNVALGLTSQEARDLVGELNLSTAVLDAFNQGIDATADHAERAAEALNLMRAGAAGGSLVGDALGPTLEYLAIVEEKLTGIAEVSGIDVFAPFLVAAPEIGKVAYELDRVNTALGSTEQVIIGQTNAWASQSQGIADWATELINVEGQLGEIDRLLAEGLITQEQYNEAQRAHNSIMEDNVRIQDDVLAIQAAQSPVMADLLDKQANYIEQIRLMNDGTEEGAQQQLAALGMMDSGIQTTVGNILELGANLDNLGPQGVAAFEQMIQGAVAADPVLGAVLEQMGLISIGADGTVTVNLDGFDNANSEIAELTRSIDALTIALGGVPPLRIETVGDAAAIGAINGVTAAIEGLDGKSATVTIDAVDLASAVINGAAGALNALDGRVATSTVRTIYESRGLGPGRAIGGVVTGYASGGVVVELAEAGPEILHFASGGTAYVGQRGIYAVEPGTYVQPNNAIGNTSFGGQTFNITVNGGDSQQIKRVFVDEIAPMLADVMAENRRSAGVY